MYGHPLMQIVCANHSSYPISPGADALATVLRDQEAAGIDLVTDGQIEWSDPVTPLLGALDGVRLGPPQPLPADLGVAPCPIVEGKLRRHSPLSVAAYQRAAARAARPVKAVLTGPYTLAHTARIATTAYRDPTELAAALSTILALEVAALVAAGAPAIQIDEPAILQQPDDVRLLRVLLEPLYDAAGGAAQVIVSVYGGDATPSYAQLNTLPADAIGLDCASQPALCDAIAEHGSGKPLALGIVDGAATSSVEQLADRVRQCLRRYVFESVILQPARGLRELPPEAARARLTVLGEVRARL